MARTIHRVVVTGMGAVTPIGNDLASYWEGLRTGRNGIHRVTLCDPDPLPVQIAGEVKGWDPEQYLERKTARRTGRFAQFAHAASKQALEDGGVVVDGSNRDEIGVVMATSGGAFNMGEPWMEMQAKGAHRADPFVITREGQHMGAGRVGRELGIRGPNTTINTACASGTDALGHALNMIRLGHTRYLLAGGAEAIITPLALASMGRMGALSHNNGDPEHASRPFDLNRDGFVLGEGAGVLLLETEESALARGARIYCELAGVGWSFDATDDTAPDAEGQSLAMTRALKDAELEPTDVDYINCHGTSTPYNDRTETVAIKLALGEAHAKSIPVSSTKSMTGHLAAGAGGIEAVAAILTLHHGCIPPTINYVTPDPACDLDVVPNVARQASLNVVMSNSFGLGGQNAAAIFRRYES
ncbi:MAG TPA: beta-ketoacyl-[acyl-carrier-protein] synthase II [Dehalococcoidia bacterium]|nr:beta-ketoacyl-[acyl-carrier-protein] synthase II [Dehalococcoidia bacterium]